MKRKESRQFNLSVEGINCETMYFEHLAKLINQSGKYKYNASIHPKVMNPLEYAKRNAYKSTDKYGKGKKIPYFHIQDIEDYYSDYHRDKFLKLIDDMREAEKTFQIEYELGYTNYAFELWMLLHVTDMRYAVADRHKYLSQINRYFHRVYTDIDQYKNHDEFARILNEYVTLDSVQAAIDRAEQLVIDNQEQGKRSESYKKFCFYHDNPDLTIHNVVKTILETCIMTE